MKVIIEGKEIDLELTEEQKVAVERALRLKTGWERVPLHDKYFIVDSRGFVCKLSEDNQSYDNQSYDNANYFSSKELAENIARAQTLQRKLWRRSAELCEKAYWWTMDSKYSIYYDYIENNCYAALTEYCRDFGQVYFDTSEHAKQALEEFRDELTWYFTEFKERMD